MFFSQDRKSLLRGKRGAPRTQTCRPCMVWSTDMPEVRMHGVVMDVSPYGLRVRMADSLPPGTQISVQMMRDESFREPLASPVQGRIVRNGKGQGGFMDHGIEIPHAPLPRKEEKTHTQPRRAVHRIQPTRMHTIDFHVTDTGIRRNR